MRREKQGNRQKWSKYSGIGDRHLDAEGTLIQHTERQTAKIEQEARKRKKRSRNLPSRQDFHLEEEEEAPEEVVEEVPLGLLQED